jgi:hypothetical protein
MTTCKRCNQEMKNHTTSGLGVICRRKAESDAATGEIKKTRVEPLFIRRSPRRSYLVFNSPRRMIVVRENDAGRFAECNCKSGIRCEHIALVARIDRARFPEDMAAVELPKAA